MKNRTLNELRQTRDAVYAPPVSHMERMEQRNVAEGYLILSAEGTPQVTCDNIQCVVDARPMLNPSELKAHFAAGDGAFQLPGGEVIRTIKRLKNPR